jgi:hypothetical protein
MCQDCQKIPTDLTSADSGGKKSGCSSQEGQEVERRGGLIESHWDRGSAERQFYILKGCKGEGGYWINQSFAYPSSLLYSSSVCFLLVEHKPAEEADLP